MALPQGWAGLGNDTMSSSKTNKSGSQDETADDAAQCLGALTRVITYARDEARRLNVKVLAFCLDAAVTAAGEEAERIKSSAPNDKGASSPTLAPRRTRTPVH